MCFVDNRFDIIDDIMYGVYDVFELFWVYSIVYRSFVRRYRVFGFFFFVFIFCDDFMFDYDWF